MTPLPPLRIDERMQCPVERLMYDWMTKIGRVYLGVSGCSDMTGCLQVFSAIDADVQTILTFSDDAPDTIYERDGTGQWQAVCPPSTLAVGAVGIWCERWTQALARQRRADRDSSERRNQ